MTQERSTIVGRGRRLTDALTPALNVGLVTALNRAAAPSTALKQCVNAIVKGGQIGPRPPLLEWDNGSTPNGYRAAFGPSKFPGQPLFLGVDGHVYRNGAGYGSAYTSVGGSLISDFRGIPGELHSSFYFSSGDGLYKLDKTDGTKGPYKAGVQRGLDLQLTATGTAGFLTSAFTAAYRIVWGYIDANTFQYQGSPGGRYVVTAGGTAQNVSVKSPIPSEILASVAPTTYFYMLFRAPQANTGIPDEEYQLCFQSYLTATDVANGFIQITDVTPDTMLGADLYTNPSQETAAQENSQAPLSRTLAFWKSYGWCGNTAQRHEIEVAMLATPDTLSLTGAGGQVQANTPAVGQATYTFAVAGTYDFSGIDVANVLAVKNCTNAGNNGVFAVLSVNSGARQIVVTNGAAVNEAAPPAGAAAVCAGLTIAAVRYNAVWTEDVPNKRYAVGITGSVGTDVQTTAQSLQRCINYNATGTVYAFDESSIDTAPGFILFQNRSQSGAAFTVQAFGNKTTAASGAAVYGSKFAPDLNAPRSSSSSVALNRLHRSKNQQPEAYPQQQFEDVGGGTAALLWIQPLRDSLLLFKEDGTYRVTTSDNTNFSVSLLSDAIVLVGRPAAFNDIVYMMTTQGVVAITDAGQISNIDNAIRPTILPYIESFFDPTIGKGSASEVYVAASPSTHLVYFAFLTTHDDANDGLATPNACFVYSLDDGTWATHTSVMLDTMLNAGIPHVPFCASSVVAGQLWWTVPAVDILIGGGGGAWTEAPLNIWQSAYLYNTVFGWEAPGDRHAVHVAAIGPTGVTVDTVAGANYSPVVGDVLIGNTIFGGAAPSYSGRIYKVTAHDRTGPSTVLTLELYIGDLDGTTLAEAIAFDFTIGRGLALSPVDEIVEPYPFLAGDDNAVKQCTEVDVLMQSDATAQVVKFSFYNELIPTPVSDSSTVKTFSIRSAVPESMQVCQRLSVVITHSEPLRFLVIEAFSFMAENTDSVPLG